MTVLRSAVRRMRVLGPQLRRWLGDRPDLEVPALGVSLTTHLAALLIMAMIGYAAGTERDRTILLSPMFDTTLPEMVWIDLEDLGQVPSPTSVAATPTSFAPSTTAEPHSVPEPPLDLPGREPQLAQELVLPTAALLDETVAIRGSGAEHVGGVEGAVDRIAIEILRRLETGRTLVIWAFDASGSLLSERERLAQHIGRVYTHVFEMDEAQLAQDEGLLTMVVAFGESRKAMLPEPTSDTAAILSAISEVYLDKTGIESTFQTVIDIVKRWGKYQRDRKPYRPMIVVVTDEVGDDEEKLEQAIAVSRTARVPVYVLGSSALFGRVEGYMSYTDPETGQHYPRLPVRLGPESVELERIKLPFWFDGPQHEMIDAGFGPYALSRLCEASGGIYFVARLGPERTSFDPARMREYKPDWVSKAQYQEMLGRHPLRRAVLQAAQITQQTLPSQPSLTFPPADRPEFKDAMSRNQERAARTAYTIDMALEPINTVARLRDRETSRRWQAHYDLIRGRLLAMKVRCYEYNWACAQMKTDPRPFRDPQSNAWRMEPDEQVQFSPRAAEAAEEARQLLQRVLTDHPGTPWALLAQRELQHPFGFRWEETYVPPPPPPGQGGAARKNASPNNTPRPQEPPKL